MNGVLGKVLMIVLSHDTIGDGLHAFAKEELCLLFSFFFVIFFLKKSSKVLMLVMLSTCNVKEHHRGIYL